MQDAQRLARTEEEKKESYCVNSYEEGQDRVIRAPPAKGHAECGHDDNARLSAGQNTLSQTGRQQGLSQQRKKN